MCFTAAKRPGKVAIARNCNLIISKFCVIEPLLAPTLGKNMANLYIVCPLKFMYYFALDNIPVST